MNMLWDRLILSLTQILIINFLLFVKRKNNNFSLSFIMLGIFNFLKGINFSFTGYLIIDTIFLFFFFFIMYVIPTYFSFDYDFSGVSRLKKIYFFIIKSYELKNLEENKKIILNNEEISPPSGLWNDLTEFAVKYPYFTGLVGSLFLGLTLYFGYNIMYNFFNSKGSGGDLDPKKPSFRSRDLIPKPSLKSSNAIPAIVKHRGLGEVPKPVLPQSRA